MTSPSPVKTKKRKRAGWSEVTVKKSKTAEELLDDAGVSFDKGSLYVRLGKTKEKIPAKKELVSVKEGESEPDMTDSAKIRKLCGWKEDDKAIAVTSRTVPDGRDVFIRVTAASKTFRLGTRVLIEAE
eukprot:TRINITY_DN194_c0_g1_i2.p1 TRINITY_DN194_c0_g1~~TRINITY_DN194_c0_g1_i2.p1  ORF type:complete len:128 (+),score=47.98 TRINITY_DN194_c0_g1_i2:73-456(+)